MDIFAYWIYYSGIIGKTTAIGVRRCDDITIEVENKKTKLYNIILKKFERIRKIIGSTILTIPEFNKPILIGL
ncbi:MAG: hypothetical protein MUC75_04980 [Ignavibacteriaceae bacterium]|jgi:hypothetical protein|nr:hypothetical protein [Ignavibacteriaceae bacterium]